MLFDIDACIAYFLLLHLYSVSVRTSCWTAVLRKRTFVQNTRWIAHLRHGSTPCLLSTIIIKTKGERIAAIISLPWSQPIPKKCFHRSYVRSRLLCGLRQGKIYRISLYVKSLYPALLDSAGVYFSNYDFLFENAALSFHTSVCLFCKCKAKTEQAWY